MNFVQIKDVVLNVSSWNPVRDGHDQLIQYIDLSSVDQDTKVICPNKPIIAREAPSRARQLIQKGDVLVSTVRPNLNGVAMVDFGLDGATASTGFCVLRSDIKKLDGSYLFHWVKSPDFMSDMVRKATGASYPAVSDRIVLESKIPLPPIAEQKRIAAILDKAEEIRSQRRQALEQLDAIAQSIFLEMFGDPVTNPKGWETYLLSDLIVDGLQNGLYKPASDYGEGTPILRIDGFYNGQVTELSSLKRVRISLTEQETYSLQENDIVINRVNSIEYLGKSALIPRLFEPTVFESNMMRFRLNSKYVCPHFLIEFLQTPFIKMQIRTGTKDAVNQSSINQQDVKSFQIRIPPIALQQEFARRVEAIAQLKTTHRESLAQLDDLFASLQHRAFRGEL
jgi:type I restriction enzyme, S subunit